MRKDCCGYCKFYHQSICRFHGQEVTPFEAPCKDYKIDYCLVDKPEEPTADAVNHPAHYTDGGIETIDFIEAKKLPYHLGNAIKYISRAGKKDSDKTIEDINKAIWYLHRYIKVLEKADEN